MGGELRANSEESAVRSMGEAREQPTSRAAPPRTRLSKAPKAARPLQSRAQPTPTQARTRSSEHIERRLKRDSVTSHAYRRARPHGGLCVRPRPDLDAPAEKYPRTADFVRRRRVCPTHRHEKSPRGRGLFVDALIKSFGLPIRFAEIPSCPEGILKNGKPTVKPGTESCYCQGTGKRLIGAYPCAPFGRRTLAKATPSPIRKSVCRKCGDIRKETK